MAHHFTQRAVRHIVDQWHIRLVGDVEIAVEFGDKRIDSNQRAGLHGLPPQLVEILHLGSADRTPPVSFRLWKKLRNANPGLVLPVIPPIGARVDMRS